MPKDYHTPKGERLVKQVDADLQDELDNLEVSVTDADTGEPLPSTPLSPHEQIEWEHRVSLIRDAQ